jgi:hypothetical protein
MVLFVQNIVIKISKIWFGIRYPEKIYSRSRFLDPGGEKGTGSRVRIRDTAIKKTLRCIHPVLTSLHVSI